MLTRSRKALETIEWVGIGVVVVLLIAGAFGYVYWTIQKGLPTINGSAKVDGLSAGNVKSFSGTVTDRSNRAPGVTKLLAQFATMTFRLFSACQPGQQEAQSAYGRLADA